MQFHVFPYLTLLPVASHLVIEELLAAAVRPWLDTDQYLHRLQSLRSCYELCAAAIVVVVFVVMTRTCRAPLAARTQRHPLPSSIKVT